MGLTNKLTLPLVFTLAGCASRAPVQQVSYKPYSSPKVREEYGFKTFKTLGHVERREPYVENNFLYVTGYSEIHSNEQGARRWAKFNAFSTMMKFFNVKEIYVEGFKSLEWEIHEVMKGNQTGYVAEVKCRMPMTLNKILSNP